MIHAPIAHPTHRTVAHMPNGRCVPVVTFTLSDITLDPELQPRATLDRSTWEQYMYLLGDGVKLPPVTVFRDGEVHWLADGYHRWHAHKALGAEQIDAEVRKGSRDDALRFMLKANAKHGRPREPGDYQKAYQTACAHGFVRNAASAEEVQQALDCSMRTAYDLTQAKRDEIEAKRNAEIAAKKAEGKSVREIARETQLPRATVQDRVRNLQAANTGHPGELPLEQPKPEPPGFAEYRELTSERSERWWGAIRALQKIGEQASVDELLADRVSGVERVFEPALREAHAWVSDLHRRYFDE